MKKINKLVALLLAVVMVLGMMPTMSVHAHAHGVEVQGIEEYPAIALDTETAINITEGGQEFFFTFTPEVSDLYYFYGNSTGYVDTIGNLYDANMTLLASNDTAPYDAPVTVGSGQFFIAYEMEAGATYVLSTRMWSSYSTASYTVILTQGHNYVGAVTKEPTCAEDGIRTYTCTLCGDSYEETIPSVHNYGEEDGKCIYCGKDYLITGTCGENMTWSLDWFGTLTISGTGDMDNYASAYYGTPAPWYNQYRNQIKSVVIEDGINAIGDYAFYQCMNLASVTMTDSVTKLGSYAFHYCYALSDVTLSDNITEIPNYCFSYTAITDLDWPANLTTLGPNSFASSDLAIDRLPEGLTTIGQYAFSYCSNISKLTLPTTVTTLDSYAFYGMYYLKEVVFTGDAPSISSSAFYSVTATVWYPLGNETWTSTVDQSYGGTLTWKATCGENHTFSEPQIIPAACEKGSYEITTCTVCGYAVIGEENDDALGHDYITEHYDGGCGDERYDIITCSRCDYYSEANWAWNDHVYESSQVPATCEEEGYVLYTCVNCGYSYQGTRSSALGHNVTSWSDATEVTCTEDSTHTGICERCEKSVTEVVTNALGHEWDMANGVENADGTISYPCIRCDATHTTEGFNLYVGDNHFSLDASAGRKTKTFNAEADGTLIITISDLCFYNNWSNSWVALALDEVFAEGYFNIFINNTIAAYTVNGSGSESTIVLDATNVQAGDAVTVELYQQEESYYNYYTVQCNMNLAFTAAEPEVPAGPALVLGDNEFNVANLANSEVYSWTAEEDNTVSIEMTKLVLDFYGWLSEENPAFYLMDRSITMKINGESVYTAKNTLDVKAGDVITVQVGNTTGFGSTIVVNLSIVEPHTHNYEAVVTAPTCTEGGYTTYTCECGDSYIADETAALGHDWNNGVCANCGEQEPVDPSDPWGKKNWVKVEVDSETIWNDTEGNFEYAWDGNLDTIWHSDWKNGKDVLTGENTISGTIDFSREYVINQFSFTPRQDYTYWENGSGVVLQASLYVKDADDTEWKLVAEHVEFEHNQNKKTIYFEEQAVRYVKFVAEKSAYMHTDDGRQEGWVAVAEFDIDLVKAPEHEHSYEAVVTAPTCTEGGYTTYTCACGDSYVADETAALGHTAAEAVIENVVDATCTEAGSYESVVYCAVCNAEISRDTVAIDALGHTEEVLPAVDASCTETGLTEGKKCSVCDEILVAQEVVPATGHSWKGTGCENCDEVRENPFVDVNEKTHASFFDAILWAVEEGITTGTDATHFNPNGKCDRATIVTFLWRAAGKPEPTTTENPFVDVKESHFFYKAVLWAYENGITTGIDATHFNPYGKCTRAQVVTFLWRAEGKPAPTSTESTFSDVTNAKEFYYNAVLWAAENGITNGINATTFGVNSICNRAQVVTFLFRCAK